MRPSLRCTLVVCLLVAAGVSAVACKSETPAQKEGAPAVAPGQPATPEAAKGTGTAGAGQTAEATPTGKEQAARPEPTAEKLPEPAKQEMKTEEPTASAEAAPAEAKPAEMAAEERMDRAREMVGSKTVVGILGSDFGSGDGGFAGGLGAATGAADEDKKKGKDEARAMPVETWKRAAAAPNTAKLMIGDKEELPLRGSEVNVQIDGFRARVVIDYYFYNDRGGQYEGTFKLRLPNEASPYFLAFGASRLEAVEADSHPRFEMAGKGGRRGFTPDRIMEDRKEVWEQPKEARMVPKEKAAYAYRETVRRRVDPALMEWSGADIFSSRIFPIQANRLHRVVVGYEVDLTRAGTDLEYRFDMPEGLPKTVVTLNVGKVPGASYVVTPDTAPKEADGRMVYRYEFPLERAVTLRLSNVGDLAMAGSDEKTGDYFAAKFTPRLPEAGASTASTAVFAIDVSLSSNPEAFNIWLALIQQILEANRADLKSFAVMFFNIETFWWKEQIVPNTAETTAELMAYAQTLALEGATDVAGALRQAANPSWMPGPTDAGRYDIFLLSDGSATWGESDPYAISAALKGGRAASLFAYQTGMTGTDIRMLGHVARETGGAVFSVVGEAEIRKAATAHRQRPWLLEGMSVAGGSDLLIAGRPNVLYPGQQILLVGRGKLAGATAVDLKVRRGDEALTVTMPLPGAIGSDLTPRIYGQTAVNQLEEFVDATQKQSEAYARHFRVTGQSCSLLMLESEADYLRFNIKPEDDAFVVKATLAGDLVAKVIRELGASLGDPKVAFMHWLHKMGKVPGMSFEPSSAFEMVLEKLPPSAFDVKAPAIACKDHTWKGVPGLLQEQLKTHQLDYDVVSVDAKRRLDTLGASDALKGLSSLVENSPGDGVLSLDVGFSAMEMGLGGTAFHLFRRVAASRPFEPQTYRAMAQCLEELKMADLALVYYEVGLTGGWDGRFGEFRKILAMDYLRMLRRIQSGELTSSVPDYAAARRDSVAQELGAAATDLVISITWNTDGTDVDLHVTEPGGEECYFSHPNTASGARLTTDVTQGFGPEMYMSTKAKKGQYRVQVKYFASDWNRATTRTKVYATIIRNWGTPNESVQKKVVTLELGKEMHDIALVDVK